MTTTEKEVGAKISSHGTVSTTPPPPSSSSSSSQQNASQYQIPTEIRNLFAGGIAGMVAKSVVAPIDRIKIMYQVSSTTFRLRDVPEVALRIVRMEGMRALWKGNLATMIRVFPYAGVQFMVFDRCKMYFLRLHHDRGGVRRDNDDEEEEVVDVGGNGEEVIKVTTTTTTTAAAQSGGDKKAEKWGLTPIESLVSGSCAGLLSVMATYPLDLTRAQLAVLKSKGGVSNSGDKFTTVLFGNYTRSGIMGLYRGITPTFIGILPYSGIAFTINEQGKREIQHLTGRPPKTIERMICGALAGLIAQSITYPLEVTRRRMQTIGIVSTSGLSAVDGVGKEGLATTTTAAATTAVSGQSPPPSMVKTMITLLSEQGVRGFFKGVTMNWMKGPVAFSISFTVFDTVQNFLSTDGEKLERRPR